MSEFIRRLIDMLKMPLTEDAAHRNEILNTINGMSRALIEHVIKLTILEADDGLRHHWLKECRAFINQVRYMIGKNGKFLKAKDYKSSFFEKYLDPEIVGLKNIQRFRNKIKEEYPLVQKKITNEELLRFLNHWFSDLAIAMSGESDEAVYEVINRLI